jgi:hypothetical protein
MALITISGVAMPTPTDLQVGIQDISKAERNANGTMIIERVTTKIKLNFTYAYINENDAAFILKHIAPTSYRVTFLHPETKYITSGTFYCGDRNLGMIDYVKEVPRYKDFTFNLIEL